MNDRFHPVVISRYLGMYRRSDPTCWAIADRDHANRIHDDRKFYTYDEAKIAADNLNGGANGSTSTD